MKGCERGFGSASQRGPHLHIRQESYCLGETKLYWRLWEFQGGFARFKEASGNPKTQPTLTECVLCGQFPVRLSQAIVLRNPQSTSGLVIAIDPQRLNNSPKVTEWVGGPSLQGPNIQFSFLCVHANPGLYWGKESRHTQAQGSNDRSREQRTARPGALDWPPSAISSSQGHFGNIPLMLCTLFSLGFPGGSDSKESSCKCRRPGFNPWIGKIP